MSCEICACLVHHARMGFVVTEHDCGGGDYRYGVKWLDTGIHIVAWYAYASAEAAAMQHIVNRLVAAENAIACLREFLTWTKYPDTPFALKAKAAVESWNVITTQHPAVVGPNQNGPRQDTFIVGR